MYCILFDEETENVSVYKNLDCVYSNSRQVYLKNKEDISYYSLIDLAVKKLKSQICFDIIDLAKGVIYEDKIKSKIKK